MESTMGQTLRKMRRALFGRTADSHMRRLLKDSMRQQLPRYGLAILAMIIVAAATAGTAWIMKDIVDSMTDSQDLNRVFLVAGGVAAIFTIKGIATYVQVISLTHAGNRIVAEQQGKLFDKLLRQGVSFFNLTESSDLLMRVTNSAQAARAVIDILVTSFVRDLLSLVGLIAVMVYQQPLLSMVSLVVGPVSIFGMRIILRKVRAIMKHEMTSLAEIIKVVQETARGIRIIKAFGLEAQMRRRMYEAVANVEQRANAVSRLEAITSPLMETLSGFAIAGVVALSAVDMMGGTRSTAGELMSFVTALLMAYEPAKRLSRMRVSVEANMSRVRLMFELLDAPDTLSEAENPQVLRPGPGEIRFHDVTFSYGEDKRVVSGLNLTCPPGRMTALVGPSGGGKSTLLNLILRMYDPDSGQVTIDGQDIRQASFASLRERIAFVGQDTFLFSASVYDNIAIGRQGATEAEVLEAARAANAHEFIEGLPQGYATPVGENGAFLSGGQKQRLAIARAILRDAEILLLDEATSALDTHSEVLVRDAIARLSVGRTVVVIAHRLSTVMDADKICVIEAGQVKEEGSVVALMAAGGAFSDLYNRQFAPGQGMASQE
jgi:ATP-binding cassette, subfamily B, bacterial MsbA